MTSSESHPGDGVSTRRGPPTWLPLTLVICSLLVLLVFPFLMGPGSLLRRGTAGEMAAAASQRVAVLSAQLDEEREDVMRVLGQAPDPLEGARLRRADARRAIEALAPLRRDAYLEKRIAGAERDANALFAVVDSVRGAAPRTEAARRDAAARVDARWRDARESVVTLSSALGELARQDRWKLTAPERAEALLRFLLVFIALTSSLVVAGIERRSRAAARAADRARREKTALLDSLREGVFGADPEGFCSFINRAGAELLGYAPEELVGRRIHDVIHTHTREGTRCEWTSCPTHRALATGEGVHAGDEVFWTKKGEPLPVELSAAPVVENGRIQGLVVNFKDITARKRAEAEREDLLRREQVARAYAEAAERRAHSLAHASRLFADSLDYETTLRSLAQVVVPALADSCIIYLMDEDYRIQRLEPTHRDPVVQAILRERLERNPPELDRLLPAVRRALIEGTSTVVSNVSPEGAGDTYDELDPRSLVVVPLRARNRILGAISYGSSRPGFFAGEEELRFAEELANRAALAMDNARLYGASQRAVREKNDVLGFVSHDLRSPLQAIRTGAQALLRHWPPVGDGALERRQLQIICGSAERMGKLIRDLLDIAQIESGRLSIDPQRLPTARAVAEAVQMVAPAAEEAGVVLLNRTRSNLPDLYADGGRLLQVFTNLLSNAIRFTPRGGVVSVSAALEGDWIRFDVTDTGPGIAPEDLPHVFDRYWQAKNKKRGGAGLGLAIARGFVEGHGGSISVETHPGQGTVFSFTVPTMPENEAAETPERRYSMRVG